MNILITGACGRMGRVLASIIESDIENSVVCGIDTSENIDGFSFPIYRDIFDYKGKADVIIDFSFHSAVGRILEYSIERSTPCVIATTAHTTQEKESIIESAEKTAVFYSANMSLGVAFTAEILRRAASFFPNAEIEIVETHHNRKKDSPSGTALMLAECVMKVRKGSSIILDRHSSGARKPGEIGIHSLRLGNVVGTHEVIINNGSETITIKHEAHESDLFAKGAIKAASYICNKKYGLYDMTDIMGESFGSY